MSSPAAPLRLAAWTELHEQVEALPPEEREAFDLLYYQDLPQAEAAQVLGVSLATLKRRWLAEPPKVFVGIDAPDFNLRLEHQLRQAGTPTVHFVGPSIWAWRYERIHKIRESVSHMLVPPRALGA